MKTKKFIQIYGKVMLPVIRGMSAMYFSNGTWKETAKVRRIVEVTDTYIKFETDHKCGRCVRTHGRGGVAR